MSWNKKPTIETSTHSVVITCYQIAFSGAYKTIMSSNV